MRFSAARTASDVVRSPPAALGATFGSRSVPASGAPVAFIDDSKATNPHAAAAAIAARQRVVLVAGGLFIERYGQNYVQYHKTTPACNQVHSEAECMQNSIYRRNTGQRKEYLAYLQNGGKPDMNFGAFTVKWWRLIYERTYFFRGMATTNPTWQARIVASITAPILLLLALFGWRKAQLNKVEKAFAILAGIYAVLVFFYNYNAYRYYGYPFAIQGRYLLPILPFFYYLVLRGMLATYQMLKVRWRNALLVVLAALLIANILFHLPLMIYRHKGDLLNYPQAFMQMKKSTKGSLTS